MRSILITGGTGSFGRRAVEHLLGQDLYDRIIIYSRDELKQHEMRQSGLEDATTCPGSRLRYFIGDVRDRQRLTRAMRGVSHVIHAAALKQVPTCEYNPLEALKTNVDGTANVIEAALDAGVGRVIMVGTDKAVDPINVYGRSKALAESLIVDANRYGGETTKFSATRYGNVLGSRGSVLELFRAQHAARLPLTVTDPGMTRFVLTLDAGVRFVLDRLAGMTGGEVFVPKLPAVLVDTIASAVTWPREPVLVTVGIRPGEKRHELLVSEHEQVDDCGEFFTLTDDGRWGRYSSETADRLGVTEFRELAGLVLESADNAKERPRAVTAPGA